MWSHKLIIVYSRNGFWSRLASLWCVSSERVCVNCVILTGKADANKRWVYYLLQVFVQTSTNCENPN